MRSRTVISFLGLSLLFLVLGLQPALAQTGNEDASVALYLVEASRLQCATIDKKDCGDEGLVVSGDLFTPYYAVLCVFNGGVEEGIAGLQFGIDYDRSQTSGVDVFGWTHCGNLEFPRDQWPTAGGSNIVTWEATASCQQEEPGGFGEGVTAIAGFLYVTAYSPDHMDITRWSNGSDNYLKVADCLNAETELTLEQAGSLGFSDDGSQPGYLPCVEKLIEGVTWGLLKDTYNNR